MKELYIIENNSNVILALIFKRGKLLNDNH